MSRRYTAGHDLRAAPLLSLAAPPAAAKGEEITLVADGTSAYRIVLSSRAIPPEKRAAAELQSHLKQISGAELPIVTDDEPFPERALLLGRGKHTNARGVKVDATALRQDRPFNQAQGFLLRTSGPHRGVEVNGQFIKISSPTTCRCRPAGYNPCRPLHPTG